jgi:hypothetical protein
MKTALSLTVTVLTTAITWSVGLKAQNLTISPTGLLTWSDSSTQQVVVCTESLLGRWVPLGQTISRGQDQSSVAIEFAKPLQFFKLKTGSQFRDEFDGSKNHWQATFFAPEESSKLTLTYTNGTLRIQGGTNVSDGRFYLQPPAFARTNVADFQASVDVVDWNDHGTGLIIGILSRFDGSNGYIGELWWSPKWFGRKRTVLNIFDGSVHSMEVNPTSDKDYRIVFVGVANRLTCSLYELGNLQAPVASVSITNNTLRSGTLALFGQRELCPGPYDVTIDNFAVTATKP